MTETITRVHGEAAALRLELDRLRKEYATFVLLVTELEAKFGFETPCVRDDGVGQLMRCFGYDIGECKQCGCDAPLNGGVCAWGCTR